MARKLRFLALIARGKLKENLFKFPPSVCVEFDDLETFERTKCLPLSVTMMVESRTRRILNFSVAQMPAKGKLAAISRKKYGYRADKRSDARKFLFSSLKEFIEPQAILKSDESPHYPEDVKKFFPLSEHQRFKGKRGCIVGQGELKKIGFDPLFTLNHSFAMMRANINRLARRTWCTTKKPNA